MSLASRVKPRNGNAIAPFDELRNFTSKSQPFSSLKLLSHRFSPFLQPWPRASEWHPLHLAKRWQPPQPPEPLTFSAIRIHFIQTNPSADWRPGGEAFWCVSCVLWLKIRVHSCPFVVPVDWVFSNWNYHCICPRWHNPVILMYIKYNHYYGLFKLNIEYKFIFCPIIKVIMSWIVFLNSNKNHYFVKFSSVSIFKKHLS